MLAQHRVQRGVRMQLQVEGTGGSSGDVGAGRELTCHVPDVFMVQGMREATQYILVEI
jgi:hypothetical protein